MLEQHGLIRMADLYNSDKEVLSYNQLIQKNWVMYNVCRVLQLIGGSTQALEMYYQIF